MKFDTSRQTSNQIGQSSKLAWDFQNQSEPFEIELSFFYVKVDTF